MGKSTVDFFYLKFILQKLNLHKEDFKMKKRWAFVIFSELSHWFLNEILHVL